MAEDRLSLDALIDRMPDWVDRTVTAEEARALTDEIIASGAKRAIEVGVASGFSSAVIYCALAHNTGSPELYSFDRMEALYYDEARNTGDAFFEMIGARPGYHLDVTRTSASIGRIPKKLDFAFVDADHRHPWPALDVLSVARFLRRDAMIALHDLEATHSPQWRHHNGPRDVYRTWQSEKYRPEACPNIGFVRRGEDRSLVEAIRACLLIDGDRAIAPRTARKFNKIADHYGAKAAAALKPVIWRHVEGRRIFRRPYHEVAQNLSAQGSGAPSG